MSTFYLIRHGEKESEHLMVGRSPGIHLTRHGREQARRIGRFLQRSPIRRIYSSPLERAIETADPLARTKSLTIQFNPAFHEVDMGEWTGMSFTKLERVRSWKQFCRFHGGTSVPGGETLAEVQARVVSEMIRLREKYPADHIAIFTHEDPIRLAICYFIGAPIEVYEHITIRLGSVTILNVDEQRAILDQLDYLPFLPSPKKSAPPAGRSKRGPGGR